MEGKGKTPELQKKKNKIKIDMKVVATKYIIIVQNNEFVGRNLCIKKKT